MSETDPHTVTFSIEGIWTAALVAAMLHAVTEAAGVPADQVEVRAITQWPHQLPRLTVSVPPDTVSAVGDAGLEVMREHGLYRG